MVDENSERDIGHPRGRSIDLAIVLKAECRRWMKDPIKHNPYLDHNSPVPSLEFRSVSKLHPEP